MDDSELVDIYREYLAKFQKLFGELDFNQPVQFRGKLVEKLKFDEFVEKWTSYREIEDYLREVMTKGATINDEMNRTYEELSAYVLEDPRDFVTLGE